MAVVNQPQFFFLRLKNNPSFVQLQRGQNQQKEGWAKYSICTVHIYEQDHTVMLQEETWPQPSHRFL